MRCFVLSLVTVAGAVTLGAACNGGRPEAWDRPREILGPIALKDRVAYVDGARDRVVVVDASQAVPRVRVFPVGRRPLFASPTPDRTRLAIVTRGQEALREGEVDEAPGLYLIDVAAADGVAPLRYEIRSPFDRIAIAADGSAAVAYFSEAGPDSDGLFRNPNELAVIDLHAPPNAVASDAPDAPALNPLLRTIRSFGAAPDGVVLSPPMPVPGAPDADLRTFAFVFAPNTLTLLDVTHPDKHEVTIRLSLGGGIVNPRELAFAPQAGVAYLRADGARDVMAIALSYQAPSADDPDDNDYRPALAELGAGGTPADVAVYDDALGVRRVLVATPNTGELTVIVADTGEFVSVPVDDPIDRILLLPPEAPRLAVLAAVGARTSRVHLLTLDGIEDELVRPNLRTVELAEPVFDVVAVPGSELTMIVHDDARTVLGMLDAAIGTVAPIEGAGQLDAYDFAAQGEYLVGCTRGVPRVGVVELANLHPEDIRLDADPVDVFALESGAIYVDHGDPFGRATIVRSAAGGRGDSIVFTGFLVAGLFDEDF